MQHLTTRGNTKQETTHIPTNTVCVFPAQTVILTIFFIVSPLGRQRYHWSFFPKPVGLIWGVSEVGYYCMFSLARMSDFAFMLYVVYCDNIQYSEQRHTILHLLGYLLYHVILRCEFNYLLNADCGCIHAIGRVSHTTVYALLLFYFFKHTNTALYVCCRPKWLWLFKILTKQSDFSQMAQW